VNDLKYRPWQKLRFVFTASSCFYSPQSILCFPAIAGPAFDSDIAGSGFWPTKMYSSLEEFAGSAVCAQCHKEISTSQRMTPMRARFSRTDGSDVLREHPELGFDHRIINLEFHCQRQKHLSVSSGKEKISALLAWAFGLGTSAIVFVQRNVRA